VLTLYGSTGKIVDAVMLADDLTGAVASVTETQAAAVAAANQWQQPGGGVPTGGFVGDVYRANAALDLNATGTAVAGVSIQRVDDQDRNSKTDWTMANQTFGNLNVGQSVLPEPPALPALGPIARSALVLGLLVVAGLASLERGRRRRGAQSGL
jgi:hypothetical protein